MVLMDDEGTKFEANALQKHSSAYEHLLKLNSCLFVRKPTFVAIKKYNHFKSTNKLCFVDSTVVTSCTESIGKEYGFDFKSFKLFEERVIPENATVDIIGAVIKFGAILRTEQPDGKVSKRLELDVQDLHENVLSVLLWDGYAEQFDMFLKHHEDDRNLVIIIQFGKFKVFREKPQVSNSLAVTRLFINADIEEIRTFKDTFISKSFTQSSSQSGFSTSIISVPVNDFMKLDEFCNIRDIGQIKKVCSLVIVGTIKGLIPEALWYYNGCKKCNTKVTTSVTSTQKPDGSGDLEQVTKLECTGPDCAGSEITPVPRFKVPINVEDSTGTVTLTMFEGECRKLLNITAQELLNNNEVLSEVGNLPHQLDSLIGRKFGFRIQIRPYNIRTQNQFYSIGNLSDDPAIIAELEKLLDLDAALDSKLKNPAIADLASPESVAIKDSFSCTGDESTPISRIHKTKHLSPLDDEQTPTSMPGGNSLKRNLEYLDDNDQGSSQSSTKPRTSYNDQDIVEEKDKLLIPKLEK